MKPNNENPPAKLPLKEKIKKEAKSWLIQLSILLVAAYGIQKYQARHLIAEQERAPGFTLTNLEGTTVSLEEFRGKPVLIYFFAPWCTVCKVSNGRIEEFYQNHLDKEIVTLGVALSYKNAEEIKEYRDKYGLSFPVLLGNSGVLNDYKISGFPTIYFIDAQGLVHNRTIGFTTETGLSLRANW